MDLWGILAAQLSMMLSTSVNASRIQVGTEPVQRQAASTKTDLASCNFQGNFRPGKRDKDKAKPQQKCSGGSVASSPPVPCS